MSGNGWCTHPKRQVSSDVRILVRKGELACRNSWGGDLWESVGTEASTPVRKPLTPDPGYIVNERSEDEVTSVRATSRDAEGLDRVVFSDPSFRRVDQEDVIVDHASISRDRAPQDLRSARRDSLADDDGLNTPAQEDQHERAQVIARGSRDAILRARERHTQRRRGADRIRPRLPLDGDGVTPDGDDFAQPMSLEEEANKAPASLNTPDPGATDVTPDINSPALSRFGRHALIRQEAPGSSTAGQSVSIQFTRTGNDVAAPVPPTEAHPDPMNMVSRKVDRERFETVPEITPAVELPRIRQFLQSADSPSASDGPSTTPESRPAQLSSYDLVLRRAQAIKSASKPERRGRPGRTIATPPATPVAPPAARATPPQRVNHLPALDWEYETDAGEAPLTRTRLPDLDTNPVVSGRRERAEPAPEADPAEFREWDEEWVEDVVQDDNAYTRATPENDHHRSWWRGLSFARPRREPEYLDHEMVDDHDPYERELIADEEDADPFDIGESDADHSYTTVIPSSREPVAARSSRSQQAASTTPGADPRRTERKLVDDSTILRKRIQASHAAERAKSDDDTGTLDTSGRIASRNQVIIRQRVPHSSRALSYAGHDSRPIAHDDSGAGTRGDDVRSAGFMLRDEHGMDAFRSALFQSDEEDQRDVSAYAPEAPGKNGTRQGRTDRGGVAVASPSRSHRRTTFQPLEEEPGESDSLSAVAREEHHELEVQPDLEFDIRKLVARQDELLDMTVSLAPDLPRTCQTCRDFRPSESGERGWCTNDWAFTHRQMVNADSLPCQSSIGCWWLPNDASWMPALASPEQQRATPRTDRLVAGARSADADSTSGTRELYVREI